MYFQSIKPHRVRRIIVTILIFVCLLLLFVKGIDVLGQNNAARQKESLERAIERDIAECYAMEGMYPPSLDYMKTHYGLTYEEKSFFVDYRPVGANLYPDYTVLALH